MVATQQVSKEQIFSELRKCMDPEVPVNVVDLGLIYGVNVSDKNDVDIKMTMTTRGCPLHDTLVGDVKRYVNKIEGVGSINVEIVWDPPWSIEKMNPAVRERLGYGKPSLRFQIDYNTYMPSKSGKILNQEDGSITLVNDKEQGFMVNENIVGFWENCDGTKTVNQLSDSFSAKLKLPREQIEQEVVQLIQQLLEAGLLKPTQ
ncbi:MAG: PqqD family peptide modification chaperone [Candidatus Nitrosocosmicus sp.]